MLAPLIIAAGFAFAGSNEEADAAATEVEESTEVEEAPAGPVSYGLSTRDSWLYVVVFADPDRWTPITAHDHAVRATDFSGSVTWDESDAAACAIDISFPVTTLAVDPPGMRARAGLDADGAVDDGTKPTIIGNMLGKKNLDGSNHPKISFSARSCDGTSGTVNVTGNLSIRGVSKQITVPMEVAADADGFKAKGTFQLKHADFEMSPFTYGPGTPKNLEKLVFVVDVVGSPK